MKIYIMIITKTVIINIIIINQNQIIINKIYLITQKININQI